MREPDATTGHAARRRLDHGAAELRAPRRRDDDVARLVEVGRVLRERDEVHVVREPELGDEQVRLGLVVPGQVGELERAADDGAEELLAADGAADDQVARVDAPVAQARGGLDELVEALRRVDEAEVRDHRPPGGEPERGLRGGLVARMEALEVDRVGDDRRADAEDVADVVVDRDRRRGEVADRGAHELRAPVAAAVRQRGAEVPDDGQPLAARDPRGRDQRRVVQVDELEPVPPQRAPELEHVRGQEPELADEEQPAAAPVGRGPDVREAGDRPGVHGRARLAEELGRRARRAVDVRLELARCRARGSGTKGSPARRRARFGGGPGGSGCGDARPRRRPMLAASVAAERPAHQRLGRGRRLGPVGATGSTTACAARARARGCSSASGARPTPTCGS